MPGEENDKGVGAGSSTLGATSVGGRDDLGCWPVMCAGVRELFRGSSRGGGYAKGLCVSVAARLWVPLAVGRWTSPREEGVSAERGGEEEKGGMVHGRSHGHGRALRCQGVEVMSSKAYLSFSPLEITYCFQGEGQKVRRHPRP